MLGARWLPVGDAYREFGRLQEDMNRFLDRFGHDRNGWQASGYPALNLWEDAEHVYTEAELPGLELKDLEILVTGNNQLSLKFERRPPEFNKAVWHRHERGFGSFSRVITLPVPVDADRVSAEFQHGVLTIKMPKSESAKPRRIPVTAG
jgi:HSP20 family protein